MLKAKTPATSKRAWEVTSAEPARRRRWRRYNIPNDDSSRWMVSYADFMTLLFAFFVVMYATVSGDDDTRSKLSALAKNVEASLDAGSEAGEDTAPAHIPVDVQHLAEALRQVAGGYGDGALELEVEASEISVTISSRVLFASGAAQIAYAAMPLLSDMAVVLRNAGQRVLVEGHTDDRPIQTARFPSNWELSAARAASVAHLLVAYGLLPARLVASGLGEHHPVAENDTKTGRAANRRVVLRVQFKPDN